MKERLLSIASGGKRKKGVALICAAALVISAGAAACSLTPSEVLGGMWRPLKQTEALWWSCRTRMRDSPPPGA